MIIIVIVLSTIWTTTYSSKTFDKRSFSLISGYSYSSNTIPNMPLTMHTYGFNIIDIKSVTSC